MLQRLWRASAAFFAPFGPVADEVMRDDFKRGEYPDVIPPFAVLRRLDCLLAPSKARLLIAAWKVQRHVPATRHHLSPYEQPADWPVSAVTTAP